jgi:hypothetical protein
MENKLTNEYIRTSKGKNDECYTYRYAVEPLLEFMEPFQDKTIWCPFDTEKSEFVKVFSERGYNVVYSHIDNGQDFYKYAPEQFDLIISNPPFSNKTNMFKRILSFNKPFAILMSVLYLNDGTPYQLFKDIDLQLLLFSKRMTFKNQVQNKINFMSCYFCKDFLPKQIMFRDFRNIDQLQLFKEGEV